MLWCEGARPLRHEVDDYEPFEARHGHLLERLADHEQALLRSQSGPMAGMALSASPSNFLTRIEPHLFRVVLLRRLRLPLPLSVHTCRCGRLLDSLGHHRAACARAGVLGRRGFAIESAATRLCREGGARVATNVMLRDLDLPVPVARGGRRLEIIADGLPFFGGAQLAVDATLVSPSHCDGSARPGAAHTDGAVLALARRRKERTYPELIGRNARARLVVLAGEIGGRWSSETNTFVRLLAQAKAREEPPILRRRVEQAWRLRWGSLLVCASARAFAASLLDLRSGGVDGDVPPAHEVVNEFRHAGLTS